MSRPREGSRVLEDNIRSIDVVGTQARKWRNWPGNTVYHELVLEALPKMGTKTSPSTEITRMLAESIYYIVSNVKQAVFLKPSRTPGVFIVMDKRQALLKCHAALRNQYLKAGREAGRIAPRSKAKSKKDVTVAWPQPTMMTPMQNDATAVQKVVDDQSVISAVQNNIQQKTAGKRKRTVYEAAAGSANPLDPYIVELVSLISNQTNPQAYRKILDAAPSKVEESAQERFMRIQLRHRFIAASFTGMTPLDFARKIMNVWGGTVKQKQEDDGVPTVESSATMNSLDMPAQNASPEMESVTTNAKPSGKNESTNLMALAVAAAQDSSPGVLPHQSSSLPVSVLHQPAIEKLAKSSDAPVTSPSKTDTGTSDETSFPTTTSLPERESRQAYSSY